MSWTPVALEAEFTPGKPRMVAFGKRTVGVYREGGEYYAILNFCPHMGAPLCQGGILSRPVTGGKPGDPQGRDLEEPVLRCPWHRWEFRLRDGTPMAPISQKVRTFPVRVVNGCVEVDLPGRAETSAPAATAVLADPVRV